MPDIKRKSPDAAPSPSLPDADLPARRISKNPEEQEAKRISTRAPAPGADVAQPAEPETKRGRGRPKVKLGNHQVVHARIPCTLMDYLKVLAVLPLADRAAPYRNLTSMYKDVFAKFLAEKPYEIGFPWRSSTGAAVERDFEGKPTWEQVNIDLPEDLALGVKAFCDSEANAEGVSISTYCYTALYWWATVVYPYRPKQMLG